MARRKKFCYKGYTGVMAGCLLFDVMCWKIIKWCILKPIWFIIKSIFKLFRWIGKQLDRILGFDDPALEYLLGCFDVMIEEWHKAGEEQEDDLSFTPPEYENYVDDDCDEELDDFNEERPSLDAQIDVDTMDGTTFEHFCADLLRVNGWTDVRVTPGSGDHGIDITAEKDDIKWGFQCKRWNGTKVDAVAVGQTYKGKAIYKCDIVVIITTSTLTAQAESEAKQLDIKVWGRGKIRQLMDKLDNADNYYLSA